MTQLEEATAIRFQNIFYEVDQVSILKNVSGDIYKGRITTLVGPSGAGKTTLLKMCNGLLSPTSGKILIYNNLIESFIPTELRKKVGIVLQSAPIIKGTVFENLSLPKTLQNQTFKKEEAISFLNDVGLDDSFLHRKATELSGGQRQKLSIARTLINRSEILLLDEITSALDPTSANDIEQLILKINKKYGVTIIWITHNIKQAKEIGHFTWVMMEGQLIEAGKSSTLFESTNSKIQKFVQGGIEK
ncbi:phosphate ABC transporter ATP-binding protein [Ureibacillus sp. NPDC094379]